MLVRDLMSALEDEDQGMEVVIRVNLESDGETECLIEDISDLDGEYLDIVDERSVLIENDRIVIIADLLEA